MENMQISMFAKLNKCFSRVLIIIQTICLYISRRPNLYVSQTCYVADVLSQYNNQHFQPRIKLLFALTVTIYKTNMYTVPECKYTDGDVRVEK